VDNIKFRQDIMDVVNGDETPDSDYFFYYIEIDGKLYSRNKTSNFYVGCVSKDNDYYTLKRLRVSDKVQYTLADKPSIVCLCGCSSFTISYGDYELLAKCTNCGLEHVVYDG
jgi:hypothetical protein